jgi:hypothetical protein
MGADHRMKYEIGGRMLGGRPDAEPTGPPSRERILIVGRWEKALALCTVYGGRVMPECGIRGASLCLGSSNDIETRPRMRSRIRTL